ncbi:ComEC/Rec2 family competence protein [Streptomonospora wellingtoniae]|uniref:ComEC/Rec2 family competence protein n=1 Tax=Streptomonospora wellingtoniae TaxID=3075544 RepID=A0ABU2KS69_9ACTN|nr:ComEC/Rec2 family competence protein [Streptomonospora sp. DSM 45055]MDT0302136.1 ComEC/Rec2 family competence protein [Streptomonospora sp. DSM 45055]
MTYLGTDAPDYARAPDLRLVPPAVGTWVCTAALLGGSSGTALVVAGALAVCAGAVWLSARRRAGAVPMLVVAVLACSAAGALATGGRLAAVESSPLPELAEERGWTELDLVVTADPRQRSGPPAPGRQRLVVEARAESVRTREPATGAEPGGVQVRTRVPVVVLASGDAWRDLLPGQRVGASGTVLPAGGGLTGGLFVVRGPPDRVLPPSAWQEWAGDARARLRRAAAGLPDPAAGLLPALVVGDTSGLEPQTVAAFEDSGLTHLLAVSGSNLAIMTGVALAACRGLGRPGWTAAFVGAVTIAAFILLARAEPSVLRAAFMAAVSLAALALGRPRVGLTALAASVLGLLLFDPGLSRSFGFALSVLATGGIMVLAPGWRDRWSARMPRWAAEAVAVALAAHVACLPLLVVLSAEVSWVAVPANVLAAPAVPIATVGGFAVAGLALVWPAAAGVAAWLPGTAVLWVAAVAATAARLPGRALPWPSTAAGAVCLAAMLVVLLVLRGRVRLVVCAAGLAAALTALCLHWLAPAWPPAGWAVVACRVGQGDALVLRTDGGRAVVVDTGPDPVAVSRCLTDLRVRSIGLLVITHGDGDHAGGTAGALSGRDTRLALLPPGFDHPPSVRLLRSAEVPVRIASAGQRWSLAPWTLDVVWPPPGSRGGNDGSIVLLAGLPPASGALRVLLTGDIEEPAQRTLLRSTHAIRGVDVLKVPHHGAGTQDPGFLAATRPDIALTSVGADNAYGHPEPSTWSLLQSAAAANYRTDVHGDIAVVPGPAGPEVVCRNPGPPPRAPPQKPHPSPAAVAALHATLTSIKVEVLAW